jgi:hypothetical protein
MKRGLNRPSEKIIRMWATIRAKVEAFFTGSWVEALRNDADIVSTHPG